MERARGSVDAAWDVDGNQHTPPSGNRIQRSSSGARDGAGKPGPEKGIDNGVCGHVGSLLKRNDGAVIAFCHFGGIAP